MTLHIIIQGGHEATVVSVDGRDYREGFKIITVYKRVWMGSQEGMEYGDNCGG